MTTDREPRTCTKCGWRLFGKRYHGFLTPAGGVTCGECAKPWPKVKT